MPEEPMPTYWVTVAPANESDKVRLKTSDAIRQNLPFAFPNHKFEFVEKREIAEQFTVKPPLGGKPDELAEIQAAVDRITTTALNPPKRWA
jgi:hypothetical protein